MSEDFLKRVKNYKETIENKIYNSREDEIEILEDNEAFIFYKIDKIVNRIIENYRRIKYGLSKHNLKFVISKLRNRKW